MKTLFRKLFFWFCCAMALSGAVFFVLAFTMRLGPLHETMEQRFRDDRSQVISQALELYAHSAVEMYEHTGTLPPPPPPAGNGPGQLFTLHPFIFSAAGTPLSGNPSASVQETVRQLGASGTNLLVAKTSPLTIAIRVVSPKGNVYLAATDVAPPPPPGHRNHHPPFGLPDPLLRDSLVRFVIFFIIGGVICYWLARHIASPVRDLRDAARRLAGGDFTARVPRSTSNRTDEIGELGHEFNRMADYIETLLGAHKQLVRDVSHELRSPLARLNVALGLARRETPPSAGESLDRIEREAERLNVMIGELLTLSMLEHTHDALERENFDLGILLAEIARDADYEARAANKRVELAAPVLIFLDGHQEMLRRAFENVIRNGIRYTDPGTAVEIRLVNGNAEEILVEIRDHGPGVPETSLQDIFRPFFCLSTARDRISGGTGIGLAITERTIRAHSGTVTAYNHAQGGLVVSLRIPVTGRSNQE